MLEFRHPEFLLLGLALPPLGLWWTARRWSALRHPMAGTLTDLPAGKGQIAFWSGITVRLLALACLVLAVAGLRWPDRKTRLQTEGIAINMAIDVSDSMKTKDFYWEGKQVTRLDAVKNVFRLFVAGGKGPEGRPTHQTGLVVFSAITQNALPPHPPPPAPPPGVPQLKTPHRHS